jgi:peroxiredoxin
MINPNDVEQYPEDSFENMKVRAKEKGFPFPYLYDETQEVAHRFGATRTPHVFLVDNQMVLHYFGAIDDSARDANGVETNYLENAIEAMRKGQMPQPFKTKAIGCSIKWKS